MTTPRNQTTVIVAHQFEALEQQFDADVLGMWLFLIVEALLFSGVVSAFAVAYHHYVDTFSAASKELHWLIAGFNTVILLTSGLTIAIAQHAAKNNRRRSTLLFITLTVGLGLLFLAIKGYEYYAEYQAGLVPFIDQPFAFSGPNPHDAMLFYNFYFVLTGLHALHMALGLGALLIIFISSWCWREQQRVARRMRLVGFFWAFVNIIWIVMYCALYLIGR